MNIAKTLNLPTEESSKLQIMTTAGATRAKSWVAVAQALEATKMTVDKFGEEHLEADHNTRLRAAEMIAKAVGDIKPDGGVANTTVNIGISAEEFRNILEQSKKVMDVGQTGEVIDVVNYRA